jgi:hypothetical protein
VERALDPFSPDAVAEPDQEGRRASGSGASGSGRGSSSSSGSSGAAPKAKKPRYFKGRCWMASDFPMSLRQLLPLLDVVGHANKHVAKVGGGAALLGRLPACPWMLDDGPGPMLLLGTHWLSSSSSAACPDASACWLPLRA